MMLFPPRQKTSNTPKKPGFKLYTGARLMVPLSASARAGPLMFYGGIAGVSVSLEARSFWDSVNRRLPLPQRLPDPFRSWLAWQIYKPVISPPVQIQSAENRTVFLTHRCMIFLHVPVEAIFPYGQTTINFDGSFARIKQGARCVYRELHPH